MEDYTIKTLNLWIPKSTVTNLGKTPNTIKSVVLQTKLGMNAKNPNRMYEVEVGVKVPIGEISYTPSQLKDFIIRLKDEDLDKVSLDALVKEEIGRMQ